MSETTRAWRRLLCVGGCGAAVAAGSIGATYSAVEADEPAQSSSSVAGASASEYHEVILPAAPVGETLPVPASADVIVEKGPSIRDGVLSFDPNRATYTAIFRCDVTASQSIELETDSNVSTFPCDGVPTLLTVVSDGTEQQVNVDAPPGAEWEMTVIEGDGPRVDVTAAN
jgi:hypothetical protein